MKSHYKRPMSGKKLALGLNAKAAKRFYCKLSVDVKLYSHLVVEIVQYISVSYFMYQLSH